MLMLTVRTVTAVFTIMLTVPTVTAVFMLLLTVRTVSAVFEGVKRPVEPQDSLLCLQVCHWMLLSQLFEWFTSSDVTFYNIVW
jgi:hypothetical protein